MQASRKDATRDTIDFDEPSHDEQGDTDDFAATARQVAEFVETGVRHQMEERPWATLAAAFGLGYVLGGGLPKMAARAVTAVGIRYAALQLLRKFLPPGDAE